MLKAQIIPLLICAFLPSIKSHGRLIEPPSRASAWRYGFQTPPNYNDHELYCGGFTRQWVKNEGKCGICGDPWDTKLPRPHEYGGTYGGGVIVRKYKVGQQINIRVELTASHNGYFEFALCPNFRNTTQECLNQNILKLARPQENVEHEGYRYFPNKGNEVYDMKYMLPKRACAHCVLQWRYIVGNNWGNCPNGTGAVGCGPQEEFRACADISVQGKAPPYEPTTEYPDETTTPTTPTIVPDSEGTYSPFNALVISIVSFLVISLILFLLYFHYYQVGKQVKNWVKGSPTKAVNAANGASNVTPLPPPRTKRSKIIADENMHEINLKEESIA